MVSNSFNYIGFACVYVVYVNEHNQNELKIKLSLIKYTRTRLKELASYTLHQDVRFPSFSLALKGFSQFNCNNDGYGRVRD